MSAGVVSPVDLSGLSSGGVEGVNASGDDKPMSPTFFHPEVVPITEPWRLLRAPSSSDFGACYRIAEGLLDGRRQILHVLVVDPGSDHISIRPVLSHDRLFGYETLGDMAGRVGAYAAVNGGFGPDDGRPAGTVMLDGMLLHPADIRFPTLFIGEKTVSLSVIRTSIRLQTENGAIPADFLNPWPMIPGWAVFTPVYGRTDRVEAPHGFVSVSNGVVTQVGRTGKPALIPEDGFLLVSRGAEQEARMKQQFRAGDPLSWTMEAWPDLPIDSLHALSCGSFLVRDGKNVAPEADPWAGSLAGPAPRTAVGVGPEGQLAFLVAEGRNPDGASGLTGKELGGFLASMGLREAALLDGGASSEIMTAGTVRNFLSAGRERLLPSGFVLVPLPVADRAD